jgi:glycosyltransferase involved in cell wall biosynthesis
MNSKPDAILYLPFVPESISWRPFRCQIGGRTLLEWFIENFKLANPQLSLRLLFHAEDSTPFLDDVLTRAGVSPIETSYKTQLQAYLQAAVQTDKSQLAFFTLEMGFAPPDLLARTFSHHAQHDNKFTSVAGLPVDCTPEIYDARLLKMVCDTPLPKVPPRLRTLVEQLIFSSQKLSPETPLAPHQTFFHLARSLDQVFAGKINSVPFDASAVYGADPANLPEKLRIRNSVHLEIAGSVIASESKRVSALDALHSWKEITIEKQRADSQWKNSTVGSIGKDWHHQLKQHVLFVSTPSAYSGAEESLCQLVGGLNRELYSPFALIGAAGYFTERLQHFGAEVITHNRDFSPDTVENLFYILSILKKVQPDVIHINAPSGMPIILAAKLLDVPIVYHLRTAFLEEIAEHLKSSDAIIAVSDFIRGEVEKKDVEKTKIRVIFDGVDSHHFSRDNFEKTAMRNDLGLPTNALIALNIARFAPNKRHDLLIAASAEVIKAVPNYHLVFVGEAEDQRYFADIVEQVKKAGLSDHATFLGFQRDIRKVEAAADALLLCSDREPLGTCLMEAMAMELPVVVTDSGGSHELFIDGVTGLITKGGEVEELARAIKAVLSNRELAQSLVTHARDYATTELSVERHAHKVMSVYAEVVRTCLPGLVVSTSADVVVQTGGMKAVKC